ncbi:MAG: hypothetical protein K2N33_05895 [Clostridia bacterium]|nr:hypothetical protein [Clostridia bacterium]MDE7306906.1 hypothetical protein [Clostridia bacterium]
MEFDIIDITQEEINKLTTVQMKLLRTAQQKKDELYRKAEKELKVYRALTLGAGMKYSSLFSSKQAELQAEINYETAILADNLIYNMSLNEPTSGGDLGESGGDESAGYIVDYSLSYNERYVIVRDYYLAISDPAERMALYGADEVAKKYLSSYYSTLYNVLYTYSQ